MLIAVLPDFIVPILLGILGLALIFILISKPWRFISLLSPKDHYLLIAIVLLGIFFRFEQPLEHQIFFDEHNYLASAKDISELDFHVDDAIYKKTGFEVLLAIAFLFSGGNLELAGFGLNILLGMLAIPLVFFITRELWSDRAAFVAAAFLAILPEHIRWSVTTSLEVSAIFFAMLGLLIFLIFLKSKDWVHFTLAILIAVYLSFIRTEMIVFAGFMIAYFLFDSKLLALGWKNLRNIFLSCLSLMLVAFSAAITIMSKKSWDEMWSGGHNIETFFSFDYFLNNIGSITDYNYQISSVYFFVLITSFIFGAYKILRERNWRSPTIFFLVISIFLFGYYSSFFAGGYRIGETVHSRFAAIWFSFFTVSAGIGLAAIFESMSKRHALRLGFIIFALFSLYMQLNLEKFFPRTNQLWAHEESQAVIAFAKNNENCLYIATHPHYLSFNGFEALSASKASQERDAFGYSPACIFFWESLDCKYENKQTCDSVLNKPYWSKLAFEPIDLWQYSGTGGGYVAAIRQYQKEKTQSIFSLIKSRL